jgi:hypothetical protein
MAENEIPIAHNAVALAFQLPLHASTILGAHHARVPILADWIAFIVGVRLPIGAITYAGASYCTRRHCSAFSASAP